MTSPAAITLLNIHAVYIGTDRGAFIVSVFYLLLRLNRLSKWRALCFGICLLHDLGWPIGFSVTSLLLLDLLIFTHKAHLTLHNQRVQVVRWEAISCGGGCVSSTCEVTYTVICLSTLALTGGGLRFYGLSNHLLLFYLSAAPSVFVSLQGFCDYWPWCSAAIQGFICHFRADLFSFYSLLQFRVENMFIRILTCYTWTA